MRKIGALNGQLLTAYEAMKRHPGKSSKRTAEITGLDRYMLARRYADLFRAGKALKVEIGKRDCLWYAIL